MRASICMLMVSGAVWAAAGEPPGSAGAFTKVELKNGVLVTFATDAPRSTGGRVVAFHSYADGLVRGFVDPSSCAYFGYELGVRPVEGARFEVTLSELSSENEARVRAYVSGSLRGCAAPQAVSSAAPRFPGPRTLGAGEGLSLDLLSNPTTGATVSDHIRVSQLSPAPAPLASPGPRPEGPVPDLRLENLAFGVFPRGRLIIDGQETNGAGCRGSLIFLLLPGPERFVFSLVPREGHDFRKIGVIEEDRIVFTWNGVHYEWISEHPVLGAGTRAPVWILKDDRFPARLSMLLDLKPGGGYACGTGPAKFVFEDDQP